jgi:hypothetical protein
MIADDGRVIWKEDVSNVKIPFTWRGRVPQNSLKKALIL